MLINTFETSSLDENKLLYGCKVLWNIFVKEIESLIFKGFDIVYECVKSMIGE